MTCASVSCTSRQAMQCSAYTPGPPAPIPFSIWALSLSHAAQEREAELMAQLQDLQACVKPKYLDKVCSTPCCLQLCPHVPAWEKSELPRVPAQLLCSAASLRLEHRCSTVNQHSTAQHRPA